MLKTTKLYKPHKQNIYSNTTIFNVNSTNSNNIIPIFMKTTEFDDSTLLQNTHAYFNSIKFSLYNRLTTYLLEALNVMFSLENSTNILIHRMNQVDCAMSNVMCKETFEEFTDLKFVLKPNFNEIYFNCLSYKDKISIICSFKESTVKNKKFLKKCVYDAYSSLLTA
jgi:hypothetical protein